MKLATTCFDTEMGRVNVAVDDDGAVAYLDFRASDDGMQRHLERAGHQPVRDDDGCRAAREEVEEFLSGHREAFDVELRPVGTDFQRRVWNELCRIPYGTTISYRELAERIGQPTACRAVARANAQNPISLAIPCHRVIGADGSLTGYGGGLDVKRALLALEREHRPDDSTAAAVAGSTGGESAP